MSEQKVTIHGTYVPIIQRSYQKMRFFIHNATLKVNETDNVLMNLKSKDILEKANDWMYSNTSQTRGSKLAKFSNSRSRLLLVRP